MKFDRIVEAAIQEAMVRGKFDNLPGKGKPIDLTDYFNTPEDVRVAQTMLKNAGILPLEIELLHEIAAYKEAIKTTKDNSKKDKLHRLLGEKQLQFNMLIEARKR